MTGARLKRLSRGKWAVGAVLLVCAAGIAYAGSARLFAGPRQLEIVASNAEELEDALDDAVGGETILLKPGNYGDLVVLEQGFRSGVTLSSLKPQAPAVFTSLKITESKHIRFNGLRISNPSNGARASRVVDVRDGSEHVHVTGCEVHGLIDSDYAGHRLINVSDSSNVLVKNNFLHDGRLGVVVTSSKQVDVVGNRFEDLGDDDIKFIGSEQLLIEGNRGAGRKHPLPGAHLDFIQGQGASSRNIVIRNNLTLPTSPKTSQQGIFVADYTYDNVLIEGNLVYNALIRGIHVEKGSTGVIIRNNTVLDVPENRATKASAIFAPKDAIMENNISVNSKSIAGEHGSNLVLQHLDPERPFHYDSYFKNAGAGVGVTIADLQPVPGSAAESTGAFRLVKQLSGP